MKFIGPRANKFHSNLFEGPKGLKVHLELYNKAKVPISYSGTYLQGSRGQTFLRNFTIRLTTFLSKKFYTFQMFIFSLFTGLYITAINILFVFIRESSILIVNMICLLQITLSHYYFLLIKYLKFHHYSIFFY
jgi:hypothetical protein